MFVVEKGDLVRDHDHERLERACTRCTCTVITPLVLSRNGQPATGSPWWTDTLNVDPGDEYVVAFRADNPGIWMDHCHNLGHAAPG